MKKGTGSPTLISMYCGFKSGFGIRHIFQPEVPDLLDTDPPENETKLKMSKHEIDHHASNNRIP